jgi:hypothetical protein
MAWLCLRNNNDYRNSQMCIVTGPNIDIAIKLIKRMKSLFERKLGLTFANKPKNMDVSLSWCFKAVLSSLFEEDRVSIQQQG